MRRHVRSSLISALTVAGLLVGAAYAPAAGDRHATAAAKLAAKQLECKAGHGHANPALLDERDF